MLDNMKEIDRVIGVMRKNEGSFNKNTISQPENPSPLESKIGSRVLTLMSTEDEGSLPENVKPLPVRYQDTEDLPDIPA